MTTYQAVARVVIRGLPTTTPKQRADLAEWLRGVAEVVEEGHEYSERATFRYLKGAV